MQCLHQHEHGATHDHRHLSWHCLLTMDASLTKTFPVTTRIDVQSSSSSRRLHQQEHAAAHGATHDHRYLSAALCRLTMDAWHTVTLLLTTRIDVH